LYKAKIAGAGKYIPVKTLLNSDLEKMVDTNDEWITTRTGIRERHIAAHGETASTMGVEAARIAIKNSGISKDEIEMVIFASMTHDMAFPASACLLQDALKIPNTGTVDINTACSGFIYAMSLANAYIASGMFTNVLVVGSDAMSRILDWTDRNTCVLFGDGAGAAVMTRSGDDSGFMGFNLRGDGRYAECLYMEGGGSLNPASHETVDNKMHYLKMNGNSTFKVAVRAMSDSLSDIFKTNHIDGKDVSLVIPHQANLRIIEGIADRLDYPMDKIIVNLDKYGNTSSATIPIALAQALEEKKIKKGDIIAFAALGAGFTWGSALMKW
jgi:3-oxoacyl-[acyl-carrier-protein] synthase III